MKQKKYQLNGLAVFLTKLFILSFLSISLISCGGGKKAELANQPFAVTSLTSPKGAAVALRVTMEDSFCDYGSIKLRKINDGLIDKTKVSVLSAGQSRYTFAGLHDTMHKTMNLRYPMTLKSAAEKMIYADIKSSFNPIEPGDYILTEVRCHNLNGYEAIVGETRFSSFLKNEIQQEPRPVLGSNYIHIAQGDFIDLGVLKITSISNKYRSRDVMVVNVPASPRLKSTLAQRFSDISNKIQYRILEFNPTIMRQYIDKAMPDIMAAQMKK